MFEALISGLSQVLTPISFLFIFCGVAWGVIGGMIPGINATIAMALLLPFTYTMEPVHAIMMFAGVYCGGEYGGSIPACLIGTPGTNAAACTVLDGYPLSQKGRPGLALYTSLLASSFGGIFGAVCLILMALPLSRVALAFGPAEYFALAFLGLSMVVSFGEKNVFKGILAGAIGIMLSTIGFDTFTGVKRYTMGIEDLNHGISTVALMMGLYAITEMLMQAQSYRLGSEINISGMKPDLSFPKWKELKPMIPWAILSSTIGLFVGVMPGAGATAASFLAYNEVKRFSKAKDFGQGNPLGIVAPESANNAVTGGAMVPLLSLGIPGSNSTAILLAAFSIHNIKAGPVLFTASPEVPLGIFCALIIANLFMVFVGLLVIKFAMGITGISKPVLIAVVIALVFTGAYAYSGEVFAMYVTLVCGLLGVLVRKFKVPSAAIVLGFVLGQIMEANLRRGLIITRGDYWETFTNTNLSAVLLLLACLSVGFTMYRNFKKA